jgi:hypothetical protein
MSLRSSNPERRDPACLSNLALDRLVTEEASAAERQSAQRHLDSCARCRARLQDLTAAGSDFAANAPPFSAPATTGTPARIGAGTPRGRARSSALLSTGCVFAAAAAAWLGLRPQPSDDHGIRIKGGAQLGFYVKRADRVFEAGEGAELRPGDELRFRYSADEPAWLAVLGIDAAHRVSQYFPSGGGMRAISAGRDVLLPEASQLDETLGQELLLGLFCNAERDLSALRQSLRSDLDSRLPEGCRLERIRINKLERPQP